MAEAHGEVEVEDRVLVIKRIHVVYTIHAPDSDRETIERVHGVHHSSCPIYRSIGSAIDITTEYQMASPESRGVGPIY